MSKEIQTVHTTGKNVYAQILDATGFIWKTSTSAFETYSTANVADYDIALTEQGTASQIYLGDMPALSAGIYHMVVRERAGGSPAEDDVVLGTGSYHWDGSVLVSLASLPWNASWDAEVQSECTDALNAYDPPTKAELDSGLSGLNDPTAAQIADAVWDEAQSGHTTAGSFGEVASEISDILTDTGTSLPATLATIASFIDTEVAAIKTTTDQFSFTSGNVDANVQVVATDAIDAVALAADAGTELADALLDRSDGVETSFTLRQALRLMLSALAGELSGAETTSITILDVGDSKNRISATVDEDGNRTAVSYDVS